MYNYELEIKGMRCSMCESHVNDVLRKNFDIKKVKSNHKKNLTTFTSVEIIPHDELRRVIAPTGYELGNIKYTEK